MRTGRCNGPQSQPAARETAEALIQEALATREDDILELDEYAREVLNGLLNDLRDGVTLRMEESQQELREARESSDELGATLQQVSFRLEAALG